MDGSTASLVTTGVKQSSNRKATSTRAIFWAMWTLFGLAVTLYLIENRLEKYFSYPMGSTIEVRRLNKVSLPGITICNAFRFMKSNADKLGLSHSLSRFHPDDQGLTNNIATVVGKNWGSTALTLAQSLENAVEFIIWNDTVSTDGRLFLEDVATDQGLCFRLKSDQLYITQTGPNSGFSVYLNPQLQDGIPYFPDDDTSSGFKVLIHDNEGSRPIIAQSELTLSPGRDTFISYSVEKFSQLGAPYTSCNNEPDYNMDRCFASCEAVNVGRTCGCRIHYMPDVDPNTRACDFKQELDCLDLIRNRHSDIGSACNASCPDVCTTRSYRYSSTERYSDLSQLKSALKKQNMTSFVARIASGEFRDVCRLTVFSKKLTETEVRLIPAYDVTELFCDIGGALCLLIGAVLLTAYEAMDYTLFSSALYNLLRSKKSSTRGKGLGV